MSRKVKRKFSSLSFTLRRFWDRILTYKPSIWIISIILMAIVIFFLGGGIYDIFERPIVIGGYRGRIVPFYPLGINDQFLAESLLVMIIYALGAAGLILTYQSTKYVYRPRQAYLMLLLGVCLVTIAFIFVELSLRQKIR